MTMEHLKELMNWRNNMFMQKVEEMLQLQRQEGSWDNSIILTGMVMILLIVIDELSEVEGV